MNRWMIWCNFRVKSLKWPLKGWIFWLASQVEAVNPGLTHTLLGHVLASCFWCCFESAQHPLRFDMISILILMLPWLWELEFLYCLFPWKTWGVNFSIEILFSSSLLRFLLLSLNPEASTLPSQLFSLTLYMALVVSILKQLKEKKEERKTMISSLSFLLFFLRKRFRGPFLWSSRISNGIFFALQQEKRTDRYLKYRKEENE